MNWNDAIQQLAETHWSLGNAYDELETHPYIDSNLREAIFRDNRVVAAKEGLSVLIGLNERIQAAVKRKLIPGYRFYDCEECGHSGKQKTRDCNSPSNELCEKCNSEVSITGNEEHPEWSVDKSGNLI